MTIIKYIKNNIFVVILLFLSFLINTGSIFYYFYKFNYLIALVSLILALFLTFLSIYFIISRSNRQESNFELIKMEGNKFNIFKLIISILIPLISVYLIFILFKAGTFSAIASPWLLIPWYFWLILFGLIGLVFMSFYQKNRWSLFFIILLYFVFFSISFFIYKIAFGYDQLLHQRSIQDILQFGLIEPKTIYYSGQYVLEIFLSYFWPNSLSLNVLDRIIVPLLSAILIPITFWFNFKKRGFDKITWPLIIFLLLPFSIFTYTVPQNLAFLFLLVLILFSFNKDFIANRYNFIFLISMAISIFFIHPLAGIPAIFFVFILWLTTFNKGRLLNIIKTLTYIGQIIVLPISLIIIGGHFSVGSFDFSKWSFNFLGQENIFLNLIYFFGSNANWWLLLLFIMATVFVFKKGRPELRVFFFNSLALVLSYLLSSFIDFPFLSAVDKDSYAKRILIISFLFLIPVFYDMFVCLLRKVKTETKEFKFLLLIFLSALCLVSLYLNYPRKDNYFNSRSFSVSQSDFVAVNFIEQNKKGDNYIVLANQQVGAVAIKEFGFKRYYDSWFYYSVQTGGLLYDYYLRLLDEPNHDLVMELLEKTGADECFIVVNDYWWAFDRIVEEMKIVSDDWYDLGDGRVYIFYFNYIK